jgi:hypothetical protein
MSYRACVISNLTLDKPLTLAHYRKFLSFAQDNPSCQWVPSEDGTAIEYTEDEVNFYDAKQWLERIIDTMLVPWGYTLNGGAKWHGEDLGSTDLGIIAVRNNEVREAAAIVTYPDPFE